MARKRKHSDDGATSYDPCAFGQAVHRSRIRLGWSVRGLAQRLGLNPGSLWHAEMADKYGSLKEETREALVNVLTEADPTLDRRELLLLAGLPWLFHRSAARRTPYEWWLAFGHDYARTFLHPEAREAYRRAAAAAAADERWDIEALARTYQALEACELSDLKGAGQLLNRVWVLLQLPTELLPERYPIVGGEAGRAFTDPLAKHLAARFTGDQALQAYILAAKTTGRIWQEWGQSEKASRAFSALRGIGDQLGGIEQKRLTADTCHFLAQLDMEEGTTLSGDHKAGHDRREWRRVMNPAVIVHAGFRLNDARQARPQEDQLALGFDWRGEAKRQHLLGNDRSKEARTAVAQATERLQHTPARASLLLDAARRARTADNDTEAFDNLQEAIGPALEIRSPFLLGDTFSKLAEVSHDHGHSRAEVLAYSAAAVAIWPENSYRRDYPRVQHFFEAREASKGEIDRMLTGDNLPFDVLAQMPCYRIEDARRLLERLARVR